MNLRALLAVVVLTWLSFSSPVAASAPSNAAGENVKHFAALSSLSVDVAKAMPPDRI